MVVLHCLTVECCVIVYTYISHKWSSSQTFGGVGGRICHTFQ